MPAREAMQHAPAFVLSGQVVLVRYTAHWDVRRYRAASCLRGSAMAHSEAVIMSAEEFARMRALLDRQDIEDCLSRIARGTDRFDRNLFLSGFHKGAMVSVGGAANSAEETYEGGRAMHAQGTFATLHCLSTMSCEIDSNTAHVETYHIYCA
jgi:hypothetical protein